MKIVGAYEAKTRLSALLDAVAKGEQVLIERRGKPVALLSSYHEPDRHTLCDGANRIRAGIAKRGVKITAEEIKAAKEEGRA
jgi:prevent-host-death family protein